MGDLKSIQGVEVFAAGNWNGDDYSVQDLDEMVRAFTENQLTLKPSLKLGHSSDQKLLQKDGYPSAGWVSRLYRSGSKLIADFVDIPNKVYELISRKAYRKVSSEIYWNIDVNGKKYKRLLSAVAFLGEDMPAVGCLDDILSLYGLRKVDNPMLYAIKKSGSTLKEYEFNPSLEVIGMTKSESEIKLEYELKEVSEKLSARESSLKEHEETLSAKEKELEDLKKFKAEADKKAFEAELKAKELALDASVDALEKEGLVTPSMKEFARALIGEEKKEYSIEGKNYSKEQMLKSLLKLHAEAESVNFIEQSQTQEQTQSDKKIDVLDAKIKEYAEKNKVTYGAAYRVVTKQAR